MAAFLPARRSKWWIAVFAVFAAVVFGFFLFVRTVMQGQPVNMQFIVANTVLSLILAFVACIFGYFNAHLVFIFTAAGVIAGMVLMLITISKNTGWEDLIGFILFLEFSVFGFVAGILLQVIHFIYTVTRGRRKSREEKGKEKDNNT